MHSSFLINSFRLDIAVNVNIWLSLDGANLDEQGGGLVVYTTKPPGKLGIVILTISTLSDLMTPQNVGQSCF